MRPLASLVRFVLLGITLVGCSSSVTVEGFGAVPNQSAVHAFSFRESRMSADGSVTITSTTVAITDREDFCEGVTRVGVENVASAFPDQFTVIVTAVTTGEANSVTSNTSTNAILTSPRANQSLVGAVTVHTEGGATRLLAVTRNLAEPDSIGTGSFDVNQTSCSPSGCSYGGDFSANLDLDRTSGSSVPASGRVSGSFTGTTQCRALTFGI